MTLMKVSSGSQGGCNIDLKVEWFYQNSNSESKFPGVQFYKWELFRKNKNQQNFNLSPFFPLLFNWKVKVRNAQIQLRVWKERLTEAQPYSKLESSINSNCSKPIWKSDIFTELWVYEKRYENISIRGQWHEGSEVTVPRDQ